MSLFWPCPPTAKCHLYDKELKHVLSKSLKVNKIEIQPHKLKIL